jgi:hypothetical protein
MFALAVVLLVLACGADAKLYLALASGGSHNTNTTSFCLLNELSGACVIASPPLAPSLVQSSYGLTSTADSIMLTSVKDVESNTPGPTYLYEWRPSGGAVYTTVYNSLLSRWGGRCRVHVFPDRSGAAAISLRERA